MKKLHLLLFTILITALFIPYAVFAQAEEEPAAAESKALASAQVNYKGNPILYDQPPINEDGKVYVPLRATLNAFGITDENITWDEKKQTVKTFDAFTGTETTLFLNTGTVTLVQGDSKWTYGTESLPKIINGRTLVPVRAFSTVYFKEINWNQSSQTVSLTDPDYSKAIVLSRKNTVTLKKGEVASVEVTSGGNYYWIFNAKSSSIMISKAKSETPGKFFIYFKPMNAGSGQIVFTPKSSSYKESLPSSITYNIIITE